MPRGNSRDYALDRLRRCRPELHAEVVAGRLSAHAAMVAAGYVQPRFTINGTSAEVVARTLRRNLPADVLAEVVARLGESSEA